MKNKLFNTLQPLGYPVYLHGAMLESEPYPDSFITIWTLDSESAADYDNENALTAWQFQVTFYSNSAAAIPAAFKTIRATLKAAGFIPQGKGRDLPSDQPTHTGWTCDFYILENEGVF